ncbi:MAG TPA: hypothetical protein IAC25_02505 [Candidatus Enterenecus stercoripullorum]|nr:hypothetical protein [Candidatus Enterenecus stercoripullorum]
MPDIDYINKQGLQAALDKLLTLCLTKSEGAAITGALEVLAAAVMFPAVNLSIPATGWQSGTVGRYTVYRDITAEVTAADSVDVALSADGLDTAVSCGMCPTVETLDGYLRFRAIFAPVTTITGEYRIIRGAAQNEEET